MDIMDIMILMCTDPGTSGWQHADPPQLTPDRVLIMVPRMYMHMIVPHIVVYTLIYPLYTLYRVVYSSI